VPPSQRTGAPRRAPATSLDVPYHASVPRASRTLDVLTLFALALCVITLVLWRRSYDRPPGKLSSGDALEHLTDARRLLLVSDRGLISLSCFDGPFTAQDGWPSAPLPHHTWVYWRPQYYQPTLGFDFGGRLIAPVRNGIRLHDWLPASWAGRERWITIPHGVLALAFALLPLIRILRRFRFRRMSTGL